MLRGLLNRLGQWIDRESSTGDVHSVVNTGKHRAANSVYHAARLRRGGDPALAECYLFTGHEINQARQRALRNTEDVPFCGTNCDCMNRLEFLG